MATERIINPRSYTYGVLNQDVARSVRLSYDGKTYTIADVTRYYVNHGGTRLTVMNGARAVVSVTWSQASKRVVIKRDGKTIITEDCSAVVVENGVEVVL